MPLTPEPAAGLVLGTVDATPLEFWIGVPDGQRVQLDDMVVVETIAASGEAIRFYGVVDVVRKRYEGSSFDSDAFRAAAGTMPVDVSYAAHVQVTRVDPEIFVPPHPGDEARIVRGAAFQQALYFDRMEHKVAIGLTRSGEPVYANLEFLDGTRGAHVSISGVSGVATKTSYATFLLYSLFHSDVLGGEATNTKAHHLQREGRRPALARSPQHAARREGARRLRVPRPACGPIPERGAVRARGPRQRRPCPTPAGRQEGVRPYLWTLREFARDRLLPFAFAEGDDPRAQLSFIVERVAGVLERAARDNGSEDEASLVLETSATGPVVLRSFDELVELLSGPALDAMFAAPVSTGTLDAFRRRLHAAASRMGHLVRGEASARGFTVDWNAHQVTVVDIHKLHATAQMFVVGVLLKRMMAQKEAQGTARPLVFVVLDELNKYAPREGWSPIHDVLLDIAERGRSLGVSLFGAQQTASEVERRVVANAALKVVGRLDAAESERGEYGFLTKVARHALEPPAARHA